MKFKDILPILPRISDESGIFYYVLIKCTDDYKYHRGEHLTQGKIELGIYDDKIVDKIEPSDEYICVYLK